jgi:hypothetical protein
MTPAMRELRLNIFPLATPHPILYCAASNDSGLARIVGLY